MKPEYLVVIDVESPIGALLMALKGKIGGATAVRTCGVTDHPLIVCSALDWGSSQQFVRLLHLTDPPRRESEKELILPSKCILFAFAHEPEPLEDLASTPPVH